MSEYKSIKGKTVQFLGTDPSDTGAEGQVWYNSTSGTFKTVLSVGAWSAGGNLGTPRSGLAGAGTQDLGLAFGGNGGTTATEEYDGSAWTAGGSLSQARLSAVGAGTQTAGLTFGGNAPPVTAATEEYNGTA